MSRSVVVRVVVVRMVLEQRTDEYGNEDFVIIDRRTVSEREWVEPRETALPSNSRARELEAAPATGRAEA